MPNQSGGLWISSQSGSERRWQQPRAHWLRSHSLIPSTWNSAREHQIHIWRGHVELRMYFGGNASRKTNLPRNFDSQPTRPHHGSHWQAQLRRHQLHLVQPGSHHVGQPPSPRSSEAAPWNISHCFWRSSGLAKKFVIIQSEQEADCRTSVATSLRELISLARRWACLPLHYQDNDGRQHQVQHSGISGQTLLRNHQEKEGTEEEDGTG